MTVDRFQLPVRYFHQHDALLWCRSVLLFTVHQNVSHVPQFSFSLRRFGFQHVRALLCLKQDQLLTRAASVYPSCYRPGIKRLPNGTGKVLTVIGMALLYSVYFIGSGPSGPYLTSPSLFSAAWCSRLIPLWEESCAASVAQSLFLYHRKQ